jgi:hypothetical protein
MTIQYVAAEFKGLARSFRQRVEAAEHTYDQAMIAKVIKPLRVRLARKPSLRNGTAVDIARALESMANPFRLSGNIEVVKRGHLRITEMVIGTAKDREDHWEEDNWDHTVSILRIVLTTVGGIDVKTAPIVTISGHAIARWFERTGSRDQSKLLADIAMILDSKHPDHASASNGLWLGPIVNAYVDIEGETRRLIIRNVRTYVSADMIDERRPYALAAAQ